MSGDVQNTQGRNLGAADLNSQIAFNLRSNGKTEKTIETVGDALDKAQDEYNKLLSNPDAKEGQIKIAEQKLQRMMRLWEGMNTMLKNMHEMLMSGIRNLKLN